MVEAAVRSHWPDLKVQTEIIRTSGDETSRNVVVKDVKAGRKGLFTAEIERALLDGAIDVAVHSAKDLPAALGSETEIAAVLPRANVDDVLVSTKRHDLESVPRDGVVATGSVRRRHQLCWRRSDLRIVDLRGNVPTRLRKLTADQWDGAILARAGLERLGLMPNEMNIQFEGRELFAFILPKETFVPAGGQGIIGMQIRSSDNTIREVLGQVSDSATHLCLRAEREFLRLLDADCNQPVGVFAILDGEQMNVRAQVFRPDETSPREAVVRGIAAEADRLAAELLQRIDDH
jgi:hydroxymethylbilane synthase